MARPSARKLACAAALALALGLAAPAYAEPSPGEATATKAQAATPAPSQASTAVPSGGSSQQASEIVPDVPPEDEADEPSPSRTAESTARTTKAPVPSAVGAPPAQPDVGEPQSEVEGATEAGVATVGDAVRGAGEAVAAEARTAAGAAPRLAAAAPRAGSAISKVAAAVPKVAASVPKVADRVDHAGTEVSRQVAGLAGTAEEIAVVGPLARQVRERPPAPERSAGDRAGRYRAPAAAPRATGVHPDAPLNLPWPPPMLQRSGLQPVDELNSGDPLASRFEPVLATPEVSVQRPLVASGSHGSWAAAHALAASDPAAGGPDASLHQPAPPPPHRPPLKAPVGGAGSSGPSFVPLVALLALLALAAPASDRRRFAVRGFPVPGPLVCELESPG